jgi:hypothetical protein
MARQRTLRERKAPVRLHFVLGEAALRLQVGGPDVMAGQHARLLQEAGQENLYLRVLTDSAGPHAGLVGSFALLDFENPDDPSTAYVESCVGFRYSDRQVQVARFREAYQGIHGKATPLEEYLA